MGHDEHDVYWNLHKKTWSLLNRRTGRVEYHRDIVEMRDCRLVVQPAGNQRARDEGRKNVHAFVRGRVIRCRNVPTAGVIHGQAWPAIPPDKWRGVWQRLHYNPFKDRTFQVEGEPAVAAARVRLLPSAKVYVSSVAASTWTDAQEVRG